jgi:hypothetical protein
MVQMGCCCMSLVDIQTGVQMQAQEVALMKVVTFCGYKDAGVGMLLTVGCNNLVPGNLVMVAGGTLGSSAAPTHGAMALGGRTDDGT